ncbi:MAG: metallopeptidase family protein [Phycisphaerales bacterium]|nr:metallopeptidase family protein [Phycisphaerales bacterium]
MTEAQRERFDTLAAEAVDDLPGTFRAVLDEVPLVIIDEPTPDILRDMGYDPRDPGASRDLMGLHSGFAYTEDTVERSGSLPSQIHLFRRGIIEHLGGWAALDSDPEGDDLLYEQIAVTLLHEIGHQMGLDEDDLERLGYD